MIDDYKYMYLYTPYIYIGWCYGYLISFVFWGRGY